jgi:hypothetical protein
VIVALIPEDVVDNDLVLRYDSSRRTVWQAWAPVVGQVVNTYSLAVPGTEDAGQ